MTHTNSIRLFGLLLALTASAGSRADARERWEFDVFLDEKPIGYHHFDVMHDGVGTTLQTEARFDVKVLFFNAFRYRHSNTERWRDGCLQAIDATTDRNGSRFDVIGRQRNAVFEVQGSEGAQALSDCVRTFAYWDLATLSADRLLNSQSGRYEKVSATYEGREDVQVGDAWRNADRYRLSADAGDITLWYLPENDRWVGLEAPAKGGRTIRYRASNVDDDIQAVARAEG